MMDKGWEQVVPALGILAAGAAYLLIDPGSTGSLLSMITFRQS
ncbi:hypothetical protein [Nostoc sp.]